MERKRRGRDQTAPFVSEDDGDFDFNALPRSPLTAVFSSFRGRSEARIRTTSNNDAVILKTALMVDKEVSQALSADDTLACTRITKRRVASPSSSPSSSSYSASSAQSKQGSQVDRN